MFESIYLYYHSWTNYIGKKTYKRKEGKKTYKTAKLGTPKTSN